MAIAQRELTKTPGPICMTLEEFLAWDGGEWGERASYAEWVNGEVTVMTVADRHTALVMFLSAVIGIWVEEQKLGVVRIEPSAMYMEQTPAMREPDIFYIANASMNRLRNTHIDGPADLVIEIVSPESRTRDKVEKRDEYERHGVPEYWIIDHERCEATFLQLNAIGRYVETAPDANGVYHCRALPGVWLRVDWLWQTTLPTRLSVLREWSLL